MQIVEDVTLARRVKKLGMRQRIAFGPGMLTFIGPTERWAW